MFTGIIKEIGIIRSIEKVGGNLQVWMKSTLQNEISIDQSIAHNGICLTIDAIENDMYRITAIEETIRKTTISHWKSGDGVNLELGLLLSDRLDGHIVQGHVDTIGICEKVQEKNGSYEIQFSYPEYFSNLVIEKGSICIDGISLTCHSLVNNTLSVSLIPYTWQNTNASSWHSGTAVNLEFDILGKYIQRSLTRS